ncbi:MAG: carbon-nitrogen family hydrolase [Verrucomicrobiae bacterium]|nr:carbon-nitrogen family hydrolase [Verrucomicrobiae bacterium]
MKILCCQTDISWENRDENFEKIEGMLGETVIEPGSLLIFPELATAGFSMNVPAIAESADGPSAQFFANIARRTDSHVLAGIPGRNPDSGLGWNEAVCFSPDGSELGRYRKNHLFPLANEGHFYEAGTESILLDCDGWKVAPFICYDLRFPELFRNAARRGADLFVVIANWPALREDHWTTLLRARAIENQAYVAGVNRWGADPNLEYSGASLVVSPTGEVIARAESEPTVLRSLLERNALDDWRSRFPALADMKPASF